MTERWRKKLGDLDGMGPGDEVFERAKEGPMRQEEPLPRTKTSTRIVTAVAAFAVFALAIAVFAIPALRMQGEPAVGASAGVSPLWPSQSADRLDQLQAEADAGTPAWATDPRAVAMRFGRDVMGWDAAFAGESMLAAGCVVPSLDASVIGSSVPASLTHITCLDPMTGECFAGCPSFGPVASSSFSAPAPGGEGGAYQAFIVFPCDPRVCNEDPASLHTEDLVLFQPLQQGPGQIWAVLEARSSRVQLAVAAGQNVRDGASIYASFDGVEEPTLGYASCGVAGASSDRTGPAGISIDVSLPGSADCAGPVPGYVWAAQSNKSLASAGGTPSADPIAEGGVLSALTAVPITAYFPTMEVPASVETITPTPEPTLSPAAEPDWQTIDDASGWTMSFPPDWTAAVFGEQAKVGHAVYSGQGGAPSGLVVDVWTDPTAAVEPADDSSFPLEAGKAISDGSRTFRADGALFHVDVTSDGPLSPEEEGTVRRIVGSITFHKWQPGDERNGWTALFPVTHDPQPMQDAGVSWQSCDQRGCYVYVYYSLGFPMGSSAWVLGPITTCGEGENMTADPNSAYAIVLECPNDPTQSWTRVGEPASSNIPGDDSVLAAHPVVRAWDGTLLTDLQTTVVPGVSHT
jgi:hypothetical protein